MATKRLATKKTCSICHQQKDVYTCRGCQCSFCEEHVDEHRTNLSRDIEHLIDDFDVLGRDLEQEHESQNLQTIVNDWEQRSIAKICLAAENVRFELSQWLERNNDTKQSFDEVLQEIRVCQKSEDFNEIDLKRWTQKLDEFRRQAEVLPIVQPIDNDETINLIKFQENLDPTSFSRIEDTSIPSISPTILTPQDFGNVLVRERFDDVFGQASTLENGLVASYSANWLGESSLCGINLYSSGTHHIHFRLLEKFYDMPFFGIMTASQKNVARVIESISVNGWLNLESPVINGTQQTRVKRDKNVKALDDLTLTLDCERRQIFLKHHRTKRLVHIPIDLRSCPFPWRMVVILHRRGDAVRISGGSMTVSRDHFADRNSRKTLK